MLLLLLGCPSTGVDRDSVPCEALEPAIEIGNGEAAHVPLADGDAVVMVHGPQGGWHVWLSFGLLNVGPTVSLAVTLEDLTRGESMGQLAYSLRAADPVDCRSELAGLFGFLPYDDPGTPEDETPPDWRVCDHARLCASVEDDLGDDVTAGVRHAEACVEVVLVPDPEDDPGFAGCP